MGGVSWLSVTYLIYVIFHISFIWVGGMYIIIHHEWSQWWLVALLLATPCSLSPRDWSSMVRPGDELDELEPK